AIEARDNVPILSYLLLRGRCRACGAPISLRYPAVEALTALAFVACTLRFGGSAATAVAALFCALLIALALIDAEHFLLPDILTLPGILLGLALQPLFPTVFFLDALLGTILGAGILILVINFWYWLRHEEGMGLGDVNMLAMVGAFLGWQGMLVTLVTASLLGALVGVTLIAVRRMGVKSRLPFGVFLAVGAAVALLWGNDLVSTYRGLL
ncbi:MAG: A24 family peptidase, partial [Acidobacteriota bacterium]|nr:A24 family peptidase [Acidobacteriota bacterium]